MNATSLCQKLVRLTSLMYLSCLEACSFLSQLEACNCVSIFNGLTFSSITINLIDDLKSCIITE